jgi:hypothetical protein
MDCDVIFLKEPELPATPPKFFAAAPKESKENYFGINTGILLMNVAGMKRDLPEFISFIRERIAAGKPEDQPMYNLFYKGR